MRGRIRGSHIGTRAERIAKLDAAVLSAPERKAPPNQKPCPPGFLKRPADSTHCATCQREFRYDTDREGHVVESCLCGRHYVPVKIMPKVETRNQPRYHTKEAP